MAVYGFKDNKCKSQIAKIYGDVTDEFGTSATITTPTGIANVGNNMENNSIAFYHVNNAGFPGSGEGTIIAFKTKGGTYKNYMFFDTVNNKFYSLAADGTSKEWVKMLSATEVITGNTTVAQGQTKPIQIGDATNEYIITMITSYDADQQTVTYVPISACIAYEAGYAYLVLSNLGDTTATVNYKVLQS